MMNKLWSILTLFVLTCGAYVPSLSAGKKGDENGKNSPSSLAVRLHPTENYIDQLSPELLIHILSFLDGMDLIRTFLVSHDWQNATWEVAKTKTLGLSKRKLKLKKLQFLGKRHFGSLALIRCKIKRKEAEILSGFSHLISLNLAFNKIDIEGVNELATGKLTALTSLGLAGNHIGVPGVQALSSGNFPALTSLNLSENAVGDEGAIVLATGKLTALRFLNLRWNNMGAPGAQALGSGNLAALTSLDLEGNHIGVPGVQALSSGNFPALMSLDLSENKVGDEGAEALVFGNLTALTSLKLKMNEISGESKKRLKEVYPERVIF